MRRLRIAFLTPEFVTELTGEGGLASYLDRITRVLRDMGHEPEVFTRSREKPGPIDFDGVHVERVAARDVRPIRWLSRLSRLHRGLNLAQTLWDLAGALGLAYALAERERENRFDFVQCSDYGLTGLFVKKRAGTPMLIRCSWARDLFTMDGRKRTLDIWLINRLERLSIGRADVVYAPSRFVAEYMSQRQGIRVKVLRPPFFLDRQPADQVPAGLPPRYLVHFGLLGPRKGTDVVAEALPLVWREEPDFSMVWAGREHLYPIVELSRHRWGDRACQVKWLGPIEKPILYAVLKGAEAAVLPSLFDNLPNTVIESLLLGVPVIGSRGASIDELVEPGVCGDLVPVGDAAALAQAMISVWRRKSAWTAEGFRLPKMLRELDPKVAASNLLKLAGFDG